MTTATLTTPQEVLRAARAYAEERGLRWGIDKEGMVRLVGLSYQHDDFACPVVAGCRYLTGNGTIPPMRAVSAGNMIGLAPKDALNLSIAADLYTPSREGEEVDNRPEIVAFRKLIRTILDPEGDLA